MQIIVSLGWLAVTSVPLSDLELSTGKPAPVVTRFTLSSGLDVSVIYIADEPIFSLYTFYPGGFLADDAGRTIWAQLAERLSTQTYGESDGATEADHLRLESWCQPHEWQQTLKAHAIIMQGIDISDEHLRIFVEDAIMKTYRIDNNLSAHDTTLGLFAQAYRHGRKRVNISKEIQGATLTEITAYRDRLLHKLDGARLCIVGSVTAERLKPDVIELFDNLPSNEVKPEATAGFQPASLKISWDYNAWYLVIAWYVGDATLTEKAALLMARDLFVKNWAQDRRRHVRLDISSCERSPEGDLFVINLAARSAEHMRSGEEEVDHLLKQFQVSTEALAAFEIVRERLAFNLLMPSIPLLIHQLGKDSHDSEVFDLLRNRRRLWSEMEWYYGEDRTALGLAVKALKTDDVRQVLEKYLKPNQCAVCTIRPRDDWNR